MKRIIGLTILMISGLIFASCKDNAKVLDQDGLTQLPGTAQLSTFPTMDSYIFKTSQPGTITLHGVLLVMDPTVMLPDPNDAIFLVPLKDESGGIYTIPPFEPEDVPRAEVDERTGEFIFRDIQPGQYAVVILTKAGAQVPARFHKNGNMAIIKLSDSDKGKTLELEYLQLP